MVRCLVPRFCVKLRKQTHHFFTLFILLLLVMATAKGQKSYSARVKMSQCVGYRAYVL